MLIAVMAILMPLHADNWMSRLPDNAYVSTLSIPGTHDSGTGNGFVSTVIGAFGNTYARTQDISLEEQWNRGIRAFDLRPAVMDDYINVNHGIMPTKLHFDTALYTLRDLLRQNPSEFAVIHLLHASEGDEKEGVYPERLLELLGRDDLKDFFVAFKPTLKVKDMRGKILLLSRDQYADSPIGGFLKNWSGSEEWYWETQGQIAGPDNATAKLYMQDYSDTHNEGGIDIKVAAIKKMLDFSTKHATNSASDIVWVYNFASAYSKMKRLYIPLIVDEYISSSDGYRDNAAHTHAAILDYLADINYKPGPTGIILMDYAGVDESNGYNTRGLELTNKLIANNFRYLQDMTLVDESSATYRKPLDMTARITNPGFNSNLLNMGWEGDEFGAVGPKENAEHYNHNFDTHQTITSLPNGVYAIGAKAFYRAGEPEEAYRHFRNKDHMLRYARLYGAVGKDTVSQPIVSPFSRTVTSQRIAGHETSVQDGNRNYYIPNDMIASEYYMHTLNAYANKVFAATDNGTLTLGVVKRQAAGTDWCVFDDFTLTYYGNQPEAYQYWLSETKKMKVSYAGITVSKRYSDAYDEACNATADNKAQAIAAMRAIDKAADQIGLNAALWVEYKEMIVKAEELLADNSFYEPAKEPLRTYCEQTYAKNLEELTLTNDQLRREISKLDTLILQMRLSVGPGTDVTTTYLPNPTFEQQGDSWTVGLDSRPGINFAHDIAEAYDTQFNLYQDVTILQAGEYELQVQGFFRLKRGQEAWSLYADGLQNSNVCAYMSNATVKLKCLFDESVRNANKPDGDWMTEENPGHSYPNDLATAAYAFSKNMYRNTVSFVVNRSGQKIRIGIKGDMRGEGWACFDNLRLIYRGVDMLPVKDIERSRETQKEQWFTLDGRQLSDGSTAVGRQGNGLHHRGIFLMRDANGKTRKVVLR